MPEQTKLSIIDGLRVYSLAASLVHCAKTTFAQQPIQMRTLLSIVTDASEVLSMLLDGGHVACAGRLAFRNIAKRQTARATIYAFPELLNICEGKLVFPTTNV